MAENSTLSEIQKPWQGVADEVRVLLARKRISSTELARRCGWSQSYISRRMVGDQPFDASDMWAIARATGVNVVDLLPRDEQAVTVRYPHGPVTTWEPARPTRSALPRSPLVSNKPTLGRPPNGPVNGRSSSDRTRPTGR